MTVIALKLLFLKYQVYFEKRGNILHFQFVVLSCLNFTNSYLPVCVVSGVRSCARP